MKELKFRIWYKLSNRMIYIEDPISNTYKITIGGSLVQYDVYCGNELELMQYTGLKDKNGVEIYEGDILSVDENFRKITECEGKNVLVSFHEGAFMYGRCGDPFYANTYLWMGIQSKSLEVIGNIHENPELLGFKWEK
jgi:uncharacterized phage protein (TIGR01671 family)